MIGIILVNINAFGMPGSAYAIPYIWEGRSVTDTVVYALNSIFIREKFYALFAFLFGVGLVLQTDRLEERTGASGAIYTRRLLGLALIGLLHVLLLWDGDILIHYAIAGGVAYLFRKADPRMLVPMGIFFICIPIFMTWKGVQSYEPYIYEWPYLNDGFPTEPEMAAAPDAYDFATKLDLITSETPEGTALMGRILSESGYLEIARLRIYLYLDRSSSFVSFLVWPILAYMVLGIAVARSRALRNPGHYAKMLWFLAIAGGIPGLFISTVAAVYFFSREPSDYFAANASQLIGALGLTTAYVCMGLILCRSERFLRITSPIRAMGRLALTNYLFQSLVMGILFYGYGMGLMGRFHYGQLLGLALLVLAVQLAGSVAWVRWFKRGPVEWVWRRLTYGLRWQ